MSTKICCSCKVEFPATTEFFSKNKTRKDGFQSYCKVCHKEYCKNNHEKILEHKRKYKKANRAKTAEYGKANAEKKAIYDKQYNKVNAERIAEYRKLYAKNNPEKFCLAKQRRKAKKKSLIADFTAEQWEYCLAHFEYKDAYTGLPMESPSQDHVIPLSKGGEYTMANIVPCERSINSSKGNRDMLTWFRKQEYYDKEREEKILRYVKGRR